MKTLFLITVLLFPIIAKNEAVQFPQNGNDVRAEILKHCPKKAALFINRIWEDAEYVQSAFGVPMALCIAQAILESGFGNSRLAIENCNYFGVRRCGEFVSYNCRRESFSDYGAVLNLDCYGKPKNLAEWFNALECCRYAEKGYTKNLKRIIEQYKLYLI